VQVSTDAKTFTAVSFVASKNSNARFTQKYAFTDAQTKPASVLYYRLMQVDFDGKFAYSATKAVRFNNLQVQSKAYPNPFSESFTVVVESETAKPASITITDAVGKKVMEKTVNLNAGANEVEFRLGSQYPSGIYLINLTTNNYQQRLKMIKK
jgi:hypothetical protein